MSSCIPTLKVARQIVLNARLRNATIYPLNHVRCCSSSLFPKKNNQKKWDQKQFSVNQKIITGLSIAAVSLGLTQFKKFTSSDSTEPTKPVPNGDRIISQDELNKHKTVEDGGIWVSFRGKVYDVTDFVEQHPGGDKILLAAGSDVSPYWALYAFHFEDHVLDILKEYYIGELLKTDKDDDNANTAKSGPYATDPERHPALLTLTKEPCNAETPPSLIPDHPTTPNDLFFVRNHLPVPNIDKNDFSLEITAPSLVPTMDGPISISLTLDSLKRDYPPTKFASTIVCAGNRRAQMANEDKAQAIANDRKPIIRGLAWKTSAISTAEWTGVKLIDLLAMNLLPSVDKPTYEDLVKAAKNANVKHIQFEGWDTDVVGSAFGSSLPIEWALDPEMDVIIAYEMNGEPLPRDHGHPLRVIVPGSIGARQVKWLKRIVLSDEESPSFYQREDYKVGYPTEAGGVPEYKTIPAIFDYPVQSVICTPFEGQTILNEGSITVKGYAFSGGGRGILSVRVSGDNGKTWYEAELHPVSPPAGVDPSTLAEDDLAMEHRTRKQWAWTLWEAELPVADDSTAVEIVCCARDSTNAVQPESSAASLNVRGLLTNCWHRVNVRLRIDDD